MRIDLRRHFHGGRAVAFAIVLSLLLCSVSARAATRVLEITASLPMIGEWAQTVGGDAVRVRVIAPPSADPHTFEPSVRSIQAVSRSQVLFILGLGLEPWAERLSRAEPSFNIVAIAPTSGLYHLNAQARDEHDHSADLDKSVSQAGAAGVTAQVPSEAILPTRTALLHPHDHDCTHGVVDPHVWLDPLRVKEMVRSIAATLSALAPQETNRFTNNADAYCALLDALDVEIHSILSPIEAGKRILVTNHNNLHYFAKRYNFVVLDTLLGVQGAAGGQPSARRVKEIVQTLQRHKVTALFADASSSRNLLEAVAAEADIIRTGIVYSVPAGNGSPAPDYLQMMRHNAQEIARLLF